MTTFLLVVLGVVIAYALLATSAAVGWHREYLREREARLAAEHAAENRRSCSARYWQRRYELLAMEQNHTKRNYLLLAAQLRQHQQHREPPPPPVTPSS